MYTIRMCDDKSLLITNRTRIIQGENNADDLLFLLPQTYGDLDISECDVNMVAEYPDNSLLTVRLTKIPELYYNRYLQFTTNVSQIITWAGGDLKVRIHVIGDGAEVVLKTGEARIRIERARTNPDDSDATNGYVVPNDGKTGQVFVMTASGGEWRDMDDVPDVYVNRMNIEKIAPYLYHAKCEGYDYDDGVDYYKHYKYNSGACSAVSKGGFVGRSYDWLYDERLSFVIHTPARNGRYATFGVAEAPQPITKEIAESGEYVDDYKALPFFTVDGINSQGLVCEVNVVPAGDYGYTTGTNPDGEDLFALMIPRYVLDYAATVDEAVALLRARNIFCSYGGDTKDEFHFMLADGTKTAVVEFVNNEMRVIDEFVYNKPIITNFYLYDYDGTTQTLTPYAMGIERYALLADSFHTATSAENMMELMQLVRYTKAYSRDTSPFWYSEFSGDWTEYGGGNLTKDTPHSQYDVVVDHSIGLFNERERDGRTWQTVHTSVYDIAKRELRISPQESGVVHRFRLDASGVLYN